MKFRSRHAYLFGAVTSVILGGGQLAHADTLTWDNNGASAPLGQDGDGTWDTSIPNWVSGDLITGTHVNWSNTNPDSAILGTSTVPATGGTSYTLDLAAPIVA